jgi:hypothetical protein
MSFSQDVNISKIHAVGKLGSFPKCIYSLWIQGESTAPDLVKLNWDRWSHLNPEYELKILDGIEARSCIGNFPIDLNALSPQAFSDVLRARLLADFGGVWADASVFPVMPLSEWIDHCLKSCTFFAYATPARDRPISSWFLAARKDSIIMKMWWKAVETYWFKPRKLIHNPKYDRKPIAKDPVNAVALSGGALDDSYYYFWFHYLFAYLCRMNKEFDRAWAACSRKSAQAPCKLQEFFKIYPRASFDVVAEVARLAEVQKLNLRVRYPLDLLACI